MMSIKKNKNNYSKMDKVFTYSLKQLITFGAHLGHHKKKRAFFMNNSLLGNRSNLDIINLNKTVQALNLTLPLISSVVKNSGKIFFIAENAKYLPNLEKQFQLLQQPFLTESWKLGTLTNFNKTIGSKKNEVVGLNRLPDLIVIVHSTHPELIIKEAKTLEIPTILFNDSNINPQNATYSIPTNDDSLDLINLYLFIIQKTILNSFAEHIIKFSKA